MSDEPADPQSTQDNTGENITSLKGNTLESLILSALDSPQGQLLLQINLPERLEKKPKAPRKPAAIAASPASQPELPLDEEPQWPHLTAETHIPEPEEEEDITWVALGSPEEEEKQDNEFLTMDQMESKELETLLFHNFSGEEASTLADPPDEEKLTSDDENIIPKKTEEAEPKKNKIPSDNESLDIYYREIRDYPPLSLEEEQQLSRKYRQEGCIKSRDKMVHHNLKLVVHIAKRFRGMLRMFSSSLSFNDLVSEGNIGLMKAIERYEADKGNKITTYASWWIVQQIQVAIQKQGKLIRVPTHLLQKMRKIQRILDEYQRENPEADPEKYKKDPPKDLEDILLSSGFRIRDLHSITDLSSICAPTISLDDPELKGSSQGGMGSTLHESLEDHNAESPYHTSANIGDNSQIQEILETLKPKEKEVIVARYGLDGNPPATLEEVGKKFGLTRERIRQIQVKGLKKLQSRLKESKKMEELSERDE